MIYVRQRAYTLFKQGNRLDFDSCSLSKLLSVETRHATQFGSWKRFENEILNSTRQKIATATAKLLLLS